MIDFKEIPFNGDVWELFSRDFLEELGFLIETPPDRGADGGKDMLVTEVAKGKLHSYEFRWLVSCKHFATSGNSVNENDHERNILERVRGFKADGFLGFYSTIPSAGLNARLAQLKAQKEIKDYRIFDCMLVEKYLMQKGYASLLMRYFPISHREIAPIHIILNEYVPINCDVCGKDLLEALFVERYTGLVGSVERYDENEDKYHIEETYFACKGKCDSYKNKLLFKKYDTPVGWKDISDLIIPGEYLRYVITTINQLHDDRYKFSDQAISKEKDLIIALAQKVLRDATDKEKERFSDIFRYSI